MVTPNATAPTTPSTPTEQPAKSVQFDPVLDVQEFTPDDPQKHHHDSDHDGRSHKRRRSDRHRRSRSNSPVSDESGQTEDLPPRFDPSGRRVPGRGEDPIADRVEDLLSSGFFQNVADNLLGAGSSKSSSKSARRR